MNRMETPSKRRTDYRIILITLVITLSNIAICTHRSSRVWLYQQSLCFEYYHAREPAAAETSASIDEDRCKLKEIQSSLSTIESLDAVFMLLPGRTNHPVPFDETGCMAIKKLPHTDQLIALVVLAPYQQLLPVVGLRPLLLVNVMFAALGVLSSAVFCKNHYFWGVNRLTLVSQPTPSLDGLCNTFDVHFRSAWWRRYCSYHDMYDLHRRYFTTRPTVWRNPFYASRPGAEVSSRTNSYNYISSLYFLGNVTGFAIGSALLSHHVYILNACSICFFVLAAIIITLIPGELGKERRHSLSLESSNSYDSESPPASPLPEKVHPFVPLSDIPS